MDKTKEMQRMYVSQCVTADWCRGYNTAVEQANEIINCQEEYIEELVSVAQDREEEIERLKGDLPRLFIRNSEVSAIKALKGSAAIFAKPSYDSIEIIPSKETIRSETIKEFAERLLENVHIVPTVYNAHFGRIVDKTVKEMAGEQK